MNEHNLPTPGATAYSYIRFSSQKQLKGDSLRRQLALAKGYVEKHHLILDDTLSLKDLGISAYDKSNIEKGALSEFLQLVRTGKIPKGSYLLVEQFDRLSRADVFTAFSVFAELIKAGVNLITLADERIYDETTQLDLGSLIMPIAMMFRSHEESLSKSRRIRDLWKDKRDSNSPFMSTECPRWLKPNSARNGYELIPAKAESVRKVFQLAANGFGNIAITRRANIENWPVPGNGDVWHPTLITRLIRNRAVIGEYQAMSKLDGIRSPIGEPRKNFFPAAIDETLYFRAVQSKATRAKLPRRRDKSYMNIFQGILLCGCCGSSYVRKNKSSKTQLNYVQYLCSKRIVAASPCKSISGIRLEPGLLQHIFQHGFVSVASGDMVDWARDELIAAEERLRHQRNKKSNVISAIEESRSTADLIERLLELERAIDSAQEDVDEKQSWLSQLGVSFEAEDIASDYVDAILRIGMAEEVDFRASLHERILRVVDAAYIFGQEKIVIVRWKNGGNLTGIQLNSQLEWVAVDPETVKLPVNKSQ